MLQTWLGSRLGEARKARVWLTRRPFLQTLAPPTVIPTLNLPTTVSSISGGKSGAGQARTSEWYGFVHRDYA